MQIFTNNYTTLYEPYFYLFFNFDLGYNDSQWAIPLSKSLNAGSFASTNIHSDAHRIWANSTANNVWCRHYIEKQSKYFEIDF